MKKISFIIAALAFAFVSCSKDEPRENVVPVGGKTVLEVSSSFSKTTLGDLVDGARQIYWANGDVINVNGSYSEALSGITDGTVRKASFSFDKDLGTPYNTLYPASIYKNGTTVTLPHEATDGIVPLAGTGTESSISLGVLTSMLKISVTNAESSPKTITKIEVASNTTCLSGNFTVDYDNCTLTRAASPTDEDKKVCIEGPWTLAASESRDFFIPVPAGTYSITATITYSDGNSVVLGPTPEVKFVKGQIVASPGKSFVMISTAAELVDFATRYNNREFNSIGSDLVVTLTKDISFDSETSDSFNATGGIGCKDSQGDNYFNGTFNGNGKTISSFDATVPLFKYTVASATIKDFTVDGSCSFTFTHPNDAEADFGAVVGYHRGVLDNVKVAANVSLASSDENIINVTALGGLVGRIVIGSIQNECEYSGLISTPTGFSGTISTQSEIPGIPNTNKLLIGGLAGYMSNPNGSISDSKFKGAISNEAQITTTDNTNPYTVIGGIVGYLSAGNVSSCESTSDHAPVDGAYSGSAGILVDKTTVGYNSAIGGIVGENAGGIVSGCTNEATIFNTIYKVDDGSRYIHSGGIAGKNGASGTVSNCTNNGTVQHRSNPQIQNLGGIVGLNNGTVTSCTNTAAVNHMTSGQSVRSGRVVSLGGVIGQNTASNKVSDVHNTANLEISNMENETASEPYLGGVIGQNTGIIDGGAEKNITNSGRVYFSPNFASQFLGYNLGGIVGKSSASVKNVKNSGYVYFRWNSDANVASLVYLGGIVGKMIGDGEISGCVNEGEIYPNVLAGTAGHNNIFAGGILGYTVKNVIISDCSNSGYVHGGNSTAVAGTAFYAGGIVAYLKGESSILDCSNTGSVVTTHAGNNDTIGSTCLTGGIAGYVEGTSESPITIGGDTGCTVYTTEALSANRGWIAGVAAYAKYAEISNCTVENIIGGGCAARGAGGIVGKAEYCTISSCNYKGDTIKANQIQAANGEGGIAAYIDNSTIDGCYCYATTFLNNTPQPFGGIAGVSNSNNTIKNCHYKSAVYGPTAGTSVIATIVASGTYIDGGGNVADL